MVSGWWCCSGCLDTGTVRSPWCCLGCLDEGTLAPRRRACAMSSYVADTRCVRRQEAAGIHPVVDGFQPAFLSRELPDSWSGVSRLCPLSSLTLVVGATPYPRAQCARRPPPKHRPDQVSKTPNCPLITPPEAPQVSHAPRYPAAAPALSTEDDTDTNPPTDPFSASHNLAVPPITHPHGRHLPPAHPPSRPRYAHPPPPGVSTPSAGAPPPIPSPSPIPKSARVVVAEGEGVDAGWRAGPRWLPMCSILVRRRRWADDGSFLASCRAWSDTRRVYSASVVSSSLGMVSRYWRPTARSAQTSTGLRYRWWATSSGARWGVVLPWKKITEISDSLAERKSAKATSTGSQDRRECRWLWAVVRGVRALWWGAVAYEPANVAVCDALLMQVREPAVEPC